MSAPDAPVRIGCAGWRLSSRVAAAFPETGSHLERYAAVLSAVEINSAFYRPHRPETYARWRDSVPDAFRFAVKMPRAISHEQRLRNAEAPLERFLAEAGQLQHKLGCLLLQLPPSLAFIRGEAEAFFALLRQRTDVAVACEPRHASWFSPEAAEMMRRYRFSCVDADPAPVEAAEPAGFAALAYLRLHGSPTMYRSSYTPAFLEAVAAYIEALTAAGRQVWCVFDNTTESHAIPNALWLTRLLR